MGVDSLVPEGKQIGILVVVELSRVIVFVVTGRGGASGPASQAMA